MNKIPHYIKEEIERYEIDKKNGKNDLYVLKNVLALVSLAKVNNSIDEKKAKKLTRRIKRYITR